MTSNLFERFPMCHHEVTRGGILEPCHKPTVAFVAESDEEPAWPVCAYHSRGKSLAT